MGLGEEDESLANGTSRLLLNEDGSYTILEYDKSITILGTNVVGFVIKAMGYTEITFRLYEDSVNPYLKSPRFRIEGGIILVVGPQKKKIRALDYDKTLPPVTLKLTLKRIEAVVDMLKGNFIGKVKDVFELVVSG